MANPTLIVRVAATIEELRANLKEGVSQIETTTASMQKMAASLSGDKLIQSAHNITAAVNQIGGASKLTEQEQARVNATLERALDKYRALGREAPPGMQKLADETKQVDATTSGLTSTVKQLAAGFLAMFTARAAFHFVKDTVSEAGALKDLAQQTHINVEELQLLAGAMSEFGVDADTLGKGLFTLSRKISKGDDSVSDALKQMGMELKNVEGLNGEELFLAIMRGLSTLQGGLRDETASDLFGSRLGMAMAGASEDIEGTIATWREFNTVMSEDAVAALDTFDESIKRSEQNIRSMLANGLGPMAEGFNYLFKATQQGAGYWDFLSANLKDTFDSMTGLGTGTEHLTRLFDSLNVQTEASARATKGATGAQRDYVPALESTAGATKRTREETEKLKKAIDDAAAATAKRAVENEKQLDLMMRDARLAADRAVFDAQEKVTTDAKAEAARGWMQAVGESVKVTNAQREAEQSLQAVQTDGLTIIGHTTAELQNAGTAAKDTGAAGINAFAGIAQQVQITGDGLKEYINLMRYTAQANEILGRNGLYTSQGQREAIAALPSPRANGGPVSAGQPYMVGERGPEMFVPERSGTIVPNGGGGGITIAPVLHFHGTVIGSSAEFEQSVSGAILNLAKSGAIPMPAGG